MTRWWAAPTAGDIVWCHFPAYINPRPKPRPALILAVFDDDAPQFEVRVAYGTSQRTTTLHRGEFTILHERNLAGYQAAGLSYDTKFDLKQTLDLPNTTEWFSVPPAAAHGQSPKLGTLHPSLVRALEAAYRAVARRVLVGAEEVTLNTLSDEFDALFERMQKPGAAAAMQRAFAPTPAQLGRAAVKNAALTAVGRAVPKGARRARG